MSRMTMAQLGVIVFAFCLTIQVASQTNNTTPMMGNSTSGPNTTTMATGTYSSSANTTAAAGAGVSLQAGQFSFLVPVAVAASVLQRYC